MWEEEEKELSSLSPRSVWNETRMRKFVTKIILMDASVSYHTRKQKNITSAKLSTITTPLGVR